MLTPPPPHLSASPSSPLATIVSKAKLKPPAIVSPTSTLSLATHRQDKDKGHHFHLLPEEEAFIIPKLSPQTHQQHQQKEKILSNQERQLKYDALVFTWKFMNHNEWYIRYTELQEYSKINNGDIYVPCDYKENPNLGRWVYKQKYLYQKYMQQQQQQQQDKQRRKEKKKGILKRKNHNHIKKKKNVSFDEEVILTKERALALEKLGFEYNGVNVF